MAGRVRVMSGIVIGTLCVIAMAASAGGAFQSRAVRDLLAPAGTLRVGINFGNTLLTSRPPGGQPGGIAVDLARELGRRLDVPLEIVSYTSAGRMADDAGAGAWDIAFLASDPDRADRISFTEPYLEIDSTYLVPAGSPMRSIADVDQEGIRIAVSENSAYELFLRRQLVHARLVSAPGVAASNEMFIAEGLDVLAGLRPVLVSVAEGLPGSRVLDGRFTAVGQAIGTPRDREEAGEYLRAFVAEAKSSGFVAALIERNGIRGVSVAP